MHDPANPVAAATHADPYPYYARRVAGLPFAWDAEVSAWVAASADAARAVLASPLCRVRPPAEPVPAALAANAAGEVFGRLARMSDGDAHRARRSAAVSAVQAIDLSAAADEAARWTRALWHERGGWRGDVGFRLPVLTLASLLCVPDDRLAETATCTTAFVRGIGPGADAATVTRGADGAARLARILAHPRVRASAPMRALVGALAAAGEADAGGADTCTVEANAIGLMMQAHDATGGLLGNAIIALADHPDVCDEVRARPDLLPALLREVLRYDPPVQNTRRWAAADGEVAGRNVRAGDAILILLAAANRDPALNPEPHRFDPHRAGRRSLTLGHAAHACPGGTLAETIAAAALRTLLALGAGFAAMAEGRRYLPSANGRIPLFS